MDGKDVHAVVIGIGKYENLRIPPLRGCGNDTDDVVKYLRDDLGVPSPHIVNLRDEEATQSAILASLDQKLINNPRITKKNAVVIYFAGHGSYAQVSPQWGCVGNIAETICPYNEGALSGKGGIVRGIPQPTLHALLSRLEHVRGCDITVILDSCHSGGMSQILRGDTVTARSALPTCSTPLPLDLDLDIRCGIPVVPRRANLTPIRATFQPDASSHHGPYTMLAACGQNESAYEVVDDNGEHRGAFTLELFQVLRREPSLSYRQITSRVAGKLRTLNQRPQCRGPNRKLDKIPFAQSPFIPALARIDRRRKPVVLRIIRPTYLRIGFLLARFGCSVLRRWRSSKTVLEF
ncbi:caspase domain-containing protein [Fomitopsis serialis]|uniref:caspase domain-containing protein n=1 Tax=Fomitopsis serialis TaxID=139415 RepID=UPI0020076827|nr:caspase domain-containing protein [Neoantrodia serialis]KAH9936995.1 caspase domain-containing protein [Neoantrodia serialis]